MSRQTHKLHLCCFVFLMAVVVAAGCSNDKPCCAVDNDVAPEILADVIEADLPPDVAEDLKNLANLYLANPPKDDWTTSRVTLVNIDDENGELTGPYANVFNCLNEEGGWMREYEIPLFGMVKLQLCNIKRTVVPDPDGSYLSVEPPEDMLDPDDKFAELMAFYHVNVIHDYFADVHQYDGMDFPLETYVNLMAYIEMENPLPDIPQGWVGIDNAMYMPGESFEQLEEMAEQMLEAYLGIEDDLNIPFKNDAIFFLQGEMIDFAYDADVIYHEYVHATIGGDRLLGFGVDEYGPDAAPPALHEANADYFSSTVLDDPIVSDYAIAALNGAGGRDISIRRNCPEGYFGESHKDGLMYSSALWEIRTQIGAELADRIAFNAILTYTETTSFQEAAEATIAEAALLDPPLDAEVKAVFEEQGLLGCNNRVKVYKDNEGQEFPEFVPGTQATGIPGFSQAAPGFIQYEFEIEEGTQMITLEVKAEAGDMFAFLGGFLGGGEVEMSVALKREGPVTHVYEPDYEHTADGVFKLEPAEDGLLMANIAGNCLVPGKHYLQLLNNGAATVQVPYMKMTQHAESTVANPTYHCFPCEPQCDGKECGPDMCGGECGSCPGVCECQDDQTCGNCDPAPVELQPDCVHAPSVVPAGGDFPIAIYGKPGCNQFDHVDVVAEGENIEVTVWGTSNLLGVCPQDENCELEGLTYAGLAWIPAPNPGAYTVTIGDNFVKTVGATGGLIDEPACQDDCAVPVLDAWDWTWLLDGSGDTEALCLQPGSDSYLGAAFSFTGGCGTFDVQAEGWPGPMQAVHCNDGYIFFGETAPYSVEATVCEPTGGAEPSTKFMLGVRQKAFGLGDDAALFLLSGVAKEVGE